MKAYTIEQAESLFWAKVQKTEGCWLWIASLNAQGYGNFRSVMFFPTDILAHRVSWTIAHGSPPPKRINVLHNCDTPACIRPDHLFLGSQKDNIDDMMQKGRNAHSRSSEYLPRGEKHHLFLIGVKITREIAVEIRAANGTQKSIAIRYGIDPSMVSRIKSGQYWREPDYRTSP